MPLRAALHSALPATLQPGMQRISRIHGHGAREESGTEKARPICEERERERVRVLFIRPKS